VILDCCFSGAIERSFLRATYKGSIAEQAHAAVLQLASKGIFYLTASTDVQVAEEKDGDEHSLLTKHLLEGIREGTADANDDGEITFSELCHFVQRRLHAAGGQRPISYTLRASGDPLIALSGRPALARKREEVERRLLELRRENLLSGDSLGRLLGALHAREGTNGAVAPAKPLIEALHGALPDAERFLRTAYAHAETCEFSGAGGTVGGPLGRMTPAQQEQPRITRAQPEGARPVRPAAWRMSRTLVLVGWAAIAALAGYISYIYFWPSPWTEGRNRQTSTATSTVAPPVGDRPPSAAAPGSGGVPASHDPLPDSVVRPRVEPDGPRLRAEPGGTALVRPGGVPLLVPRPANPRASEERTP
jgi:hypothetical protein